MSTFMANKGNIERKWYVIDAAGKPMGKTAVAAADLLRGKRKVTYTPHADCGEMRNEVSRPASSGAIFSATPEASPPP